MLAILSCSCVMYSMFPLVKKLKPLISDEAVPLLKKWLSDTANFIIVTPIGSK